MNARLDLGGLPNVDDFSIAFVQAKRKGNVPSELEREILETVSQIGEWLQRLQPDHEGIAYDPGATQRKLVALRNKANELLVACGGKALGKSL